MKKRFISKKSKKSNKKKLLLIILLLIGIIIGFKYLNSGHIKLNDKDIAMLLLINSNNKKKEIISSRYIKSITKKLSDPVNYLQNSYIKKVEVEPVNVEEPINILLPIVYIYNSHQSEEYQSSTFAEFSVNPTVMMADYILEDLFNKEGMSTIVEERSIKEILNNNSWNYASSYRASRILMENAYNKYPSLKYFIDIHRDSLTHEKTTIEINGRNYARTIFLVGLENDNYEDNLAFTEKINNIMDSKYPNLSKGIYKKGGEGVNGIYNQDFSSTTILIEIGGFENTTDEVLNTTLAFYDCFMEVINEE